MIYSVFEVVKPIEVKSGVVAPWFNQQGGGIQYQLPKTVDELLDDEIIRPANKSQAVKRKNT